MLNFTQKFKQMRFIITLLFLTSIHLTSAQNEEYVITTLNDTLACESFSKDKLKCKNGRETIKYKSKELIEFKTNDTTYYAVTGFKKKWHVHAFHLLGNEKYQIMQYEFMEAQTSGPSLPRTKLLICNTKHEFLEELVLNETTPSIFRKYFKGCHVFDDELKKFEKETSKRRFPMKDFKHLVNVYSNSCE